MYIHKEGYPTILLISVLVIIINFLLYTKIIKIPLSFSMLISFISLVVLFFIISFFRVPKRLELKDDNLIFSPADGKIVMIKEVNCKEYNLGKCLQISVFMSPLNVHQNLYPISGSIVYSQYHPGKYLVAWHEKSSELNEHWSIVIKHPNGLVLTKQIAGFVARRIVNYTKVNDTCYQNQEFGFIKFGSRVDVLLPLHCKPLVSINQIVKGALTPLASW